jgi:hypothetical protein
VTWALGAGEALKHLYGQDRERFVAVVQSAITNTIEVDRTIVYDHEDGLYRYLRSACELMTKEITLKLDQGGDVVP